MSHYFENTNLKHNIIDFNDTICGKNFHFSTDNGVFSKGHVDHLTKQFLSVIIDEINAESVLDFGCGYGVVGIVVAKYHNCIVDMLDINKRAVELSLLNAEQNGVNVNVFESDMFQDVKNKYSSILLNPPIRAGKKVCYNIYSESKHFLQEDGSLYIVISKKHGAKSTIDFLKTIYTQVEILYSKKGVYIIKST